MSNWQEMEKKYLFTNTVRWPMLPVKGKGSYLWMKTARNTDLVGGWAYAAWDTPVRDNQGFNLAI